MAATWLPVPPGPPHSRTSKTLILGDDTVFEQAPEIGEAVEPRDLLAFGDGPSAVGDRDLVDAQMLLADLRRDLCFHPEAAAFQAHGLEVGRQERLVAGAHVAEIDVVERVGEQREQ